MAYKIMKEPWSMQNTIERLYLRRERLEREDEAAFLLNTPMPRYLSFASPNPNKWGHPRSYRIQITSFAGEHLPTSSPMERSISWGRWVPGLEYAWPPPALLPPCYRIPGCHCLSKEQGLLPPSKPVTGCREGLNSNHAYFFGSENPLKSCSMTLVPQAGI